METYQEIPCINFKECGKNIYESKSEFDFFNKLREEKSDFVSPKRCIECRKKAKLWFAERERQRAEGGENADFVIGNEMRKFPHNSRSFNNNKKGERYGQE